MSGAGTLQEMSSWLRQQLGFVEGPDNDNPYAKLAGHANHEPWCATLLVAGAKTTGLALPGSSAYTPALAQAFRAAGRWHTTPQVGDFVFFAWPGMGRIGHVGWVETVFGAHDEISIEGNTDVRGGRTGGRVMRQHRRANIAGYGRPAYAPPGSVPGHVHPMPTVRALDDRGHPDAVRDLQGHLNAWRANRQLSQHPDDGQPDQWLHIALCTFQRTYGLEPDGVAGPQTWAVLHGITKGAAV